MENNSSPKKHSLNISGMSTSKKIFLAHCVTKHLELKSILLTTSSANTKKRNLCSVTNAAMITFKRVPDYLSEEEEEGQIIAH